MKKKFIDWLNGVVDRAIQSEAWQRKAHAEARLEILRERCDTYEKAITRRHGEIIELRALLAQAGALAVKYKNKADELEARIAAALT